MIKNIVAAILVILIILFLPIVIFINITEHFGYGVGILAVLFYFWLIFGGK